MTRALKKVKKHAGKLTAGLPRRLVSLLLTAVLLIGLVPAFELTAHAYSEETFADYKVYWDGAYGHGWVEIECNFCGKDYRHDFSDGDHEGTYESMMAEMWDFPYEGCYHCWECGPYEHCEVCGRCMVEEVEPCPLCNTLVCLECHEDTDFCDLCGRCGLVDGPEGRSDMVGTVNYPNLSAICYDCREDNSVCLYCSYNLIRGGAVI